MTRSTPSKKAIRDLRRRILLHLREWSAGLRCLPQFLIIGAQKSGTTSLFKFISQHKQVIPAFIKEIHYFDGGLEPQIDLYEEGERWYLAHFPLKFRMRRKQITGEASPLYLFNPLAAERIQRLTPNIKLIVLLRNPTERAISHYFHEVRKGRETLPILEAFQSETERLKNVLAKKDYKNSLYINASYKARGLYRQQLEPYFQLFPRSNLLVLESESFFRNPQKILMQVFDFLGIDPSFPIPDTAPRNVSKNKKRPDPQVYDYLNAYFQSPNKELFQLIQKTFDWAPS